jgi:hypothetical protein
MPHFGRVSAPLPPDVSSVGQPDVWFWTLNSPPSPLESGDWLADSFLPERF